MKYKRTHSKGQKSTPNEWKWLSQQNRLNCCSNNIAAPGHHFRSFCSQRLLKTVLSGSQIDTQHSYGTYSIQRQIDGKCFMIKPIKGNVDWLWWYLHFMVILFTWSDCELTVATCRVVRTRLTINLLWCTAS